MYTKENREFKKSNLFLVLSKKSTKDNLSPKKALVLMVSDNVNEFYNFCYIIVQNLVKYIFHISSVATRNENAKKMKNVSRIN